MFRKFLSILILLWLLALNACRQQPETNLPNPASVFCEQNGGKLEMVQDSSGGTAGMCSFEDGSQCDEWAFYRGECKPGESLQPLPEATVEIEMTPAIEIDTDGWQVYRNPELGYRFNYPQGTVVNTENVENGVSVTGSESNNELWPSITFSHPRDRQEFRPPAGADLVTWLTDHNLLAEKQMPGVEIAGTQAVHLRHDRSPQSYANDRYFFTHADQLYLVVIDQVGDREDWELYNHFLQSIQFER